ncbi:MAG: hypothetical protein WA093_02570 [Minisyncoccales bacterium]
MPDKKGNKNIGEAVKEVMALVSKHRMILLALALVVFVLVGIRFFNFFNLYEARADDREWKNFAEDIYGFSMDYPADWSLDVDYDRYAKGLMSAELNNKKCGFSYKKCDNNCADIRIIAGKKPGGGESRGLFTQLYEDFMMVRDFSTASLISTLDFNSKKVFKVASDQPTLALTGACAGPFYTFETDSGYFVYVFAGYGANAASVDDETRKIIDSIKIIGGG